MKITDVSFTEIFTENNVRKEVVFILVFYFLALCGEYYISKLAYPEGVVCPENNKRMVERILEGLPQRGMVTPIQRLQRAVRKVMILNQIRYSKATQSLDNPFKNPSLKKL